MQQNHALGLLSTKVLERATGELIAATDDLEVHIFLQKGRIAWAYNNQERGLFLRELLGLTGLQPEDLSDVLDECRNSRRHVAEALLEYKLAREQDIRRALWAQLTATLRTLSDAQATDAIFLKRPDAAYDERLTFDLDDFNHERFSSLPPPREDPELEARESALKRELAGALPATLWVKLIRRPSEERGRSSSLDILKLVVECLHSSGAFECAYRDPVGWLFASQNDEGYLCCGFPSGVLLSKARKILREHAGPSREAEPQKLEMSGRHGSSTDPALAALMPVLEQFDFVASLHAADEGGVRSIYKENAPSDLERHVQNAYTILQLPLSKRIQAPEPPPNHKLPSQQPALRMTLDSVHLLGLSLAPQRAIFISICPTVVEGTGWGLLNNAQRLLLPTLYL